MSIAAPGHRFAALTAEADDALVADVVAHLAKAAWPVSLPGLCNAVWFDSLGRRGYEGVAAGALIDEAALAAHGYPEGREPIGPQPAIPLGAVVSMITGDDIAYGEIVWKEGAHQALEASWVPGWLAGAPALPADGAAPGPDWVPSVGARVLRERLVVDFGCLGDDLAPSAAKLERLRRRGYRLDRFGHLVIDSRYDDEDEADDVAYWAAWTARRHPRALAAVGIDPDASLVLAAATHLADALDAHPEVRSFGAYYVHADAHVAAVTADGPGGVLHRTARSLAHLPTRSRCVWVSMSARLADDLGADAMASTAWPSAVVTTSLLTLDLLAEEAPAGDWNGVHVRLDDAWHGGGLWRTELLSAKGPVAAEPAVALGLGWVEHTGGAVERVGGPDADTELDAPDWYDEDDWELDGSEVSWLVHLTAHDIDTDRLRVPGQISDLVRATLTAAGQDALVVAIAHDGSGEERDVVTLGDDGHLNVCWPLGIHPGTSVRASWSVGSTVVVAATHLLPEPELLAGITYTHEYNVRVALAAAGEIDTAAKPVTIRQLIRAAVRRHGALTDDGCRCLTMREIVAHCFGPNGELVPAYHAEVLHRAVRAAAAGLAAAGLARIDGEFVVIAEQASVSGRRADAEVLARYVDAMRKRVRRETARHWVAPSIVNLSGHRRRSLEKGRSWAEVAGTDGLPDGGLAPNQTWRRGHPRGGRVPHEVTRTLERIKAALAPLPGGAEAAAVFDAAASAPFAASDRFCPADTAAPGREEPSDE